MSDPIQFSPPEPSELTKLLNGYDVTSLVATGGMGAVYKATQISLDRPVAIKLLPEELCDPSFREQFQAEARAMAKLNHANLIGIFDYGDASGMPYIVMEFVAGKSLYHSSYGKAIDQSAAVEIIIGICRGLAAAHDSGIIHRDIKPANILLDPSAKPKIGDFGLASPADGDDGDDGLVYGTPGYAAPELFSNEAPIGIATDLYAVGVILYELLTGKMPENPASPPSTVSKCDPRLDAIFRKATRRNPDARYESATDFANDLDDILPTLGSGGRRSMKVGNTAGSSATAKVTLKRRLTTEEATSSGDSSKPKLVALPKGEAAPASASKLTPLPEGREDDAAQAVAQPAPVVMQTGSNWPIIRNLIIIAALIPAIIFVWGLYEEKQVKLKEERDARELKEKNEKIERKAKLEQESREIAERQRIDAEERARREAFNRKREEEEARKAALSPMERLANFREDLNKGRRDKLPEGTIDRSTHFLFFVKESMTWSQASEFAARHGGHLATPSRQSEVDAIASRMEDGVSRVWIGGGAVGNGDWGWVNGDEWTFKKPGIALGSCAALTNTSVIRARPNAEKNPFYIQWSKDGTNTGAVSAQLERLIGTLDSPKPDWPPSTVFHENRAFLLVYMNVAWAEADLVAGTGDGHLAVLSEAQESIFVRNYLKSALPPGESAWLGAKRPRKGAWRWVTGETWTKASWAPNFSDNGELGEVLRFLNATEAGGWQQANAKAGNAQAFLIEWSNDAKSNLGTGVSDAVAEGMAEFERLQKIGQRLVSKEVQDYQKLLVGNRSQFLSNVRTWYRRLSKNNQKKFQAAVNALDETIPAEGGLSGEIALGGLPKDVQKLLNKAVEREVEKKKAFDAKLDKLRVNYLTKLLALRDVFEEKDQIEQLEAIDAEVQGIGQSGKSFRTHFSQ